MAVDGARGADTLAVALASALPPLLALAVFGVIETPDTPSYLDYAALLRAGPLPEGEALLRASSQPVLLFRTPGLPWVIAGLQGLAPEGWRLLLVALQVLAQAGVAALAHRIGLRLGLGRGWAILAALLPAGGFALVAQIMVMTDALYGALVSLAGLLLLRAALARGALRAVGLAGLLLGVATLVREATPFLAVALLPAAAIAGGAGLARRIAGPVLLMAPVLLAAGWIVSVNEARSGHAILSTTRQIVMVQALLPLMKRDVPVYSGDDLFDRTARETVVQGGYDAIDEHNRRLFAAGLTSPEIAALATQRYWRAWREHPAEMLRAIAVRLPVKIFWSSFMPVDMLAELHLRTGDPRPWFGREAELIKRAREGQFLAIPVLLALVGGRAIGLLVTGAAMLAPLLIRRGDARWWPLLGAWLTCAGFFGVYAPVHIEQRYLLPVIPMVGLLGIVALDALWRRRRAR